MNLNKIIKHIKRWNRWRKNNLNSPIHKLLVLFKVIESPSMKWVRTKEEEDAFDEGFKKGLEEFVELESEEEK